MHQTSKVFFKRKKIHIFLPRKQFTCKTNSKFHTFCTLIHLRFRLNTILLPSFDTHKPNQNDSTITLEIRWNQSPDLLMGLLLCLLNDTHIPEHKTTTSIKNWNYIPRTCGSISVCQPACFTNYMKRPIRINAKLELLIKTG